jgi:hypothetical protein
VLEAAAILARLDATKFTALMPPAAVNGAGSEDADGLAPRGWRPRLEALRAVGCERIDSEYQPRFRTFQACLKDLPPALWQAERAVDRLWRERGST